jgi:hypothetical protein
MTAKWLCFAVPLAGIAFTTGCGHDHDHDRDHRRIEWDRDVIVVPARSDRWEHDHRYERHDDWRDRHDHD